VSQSVYEDQLNSSYLLVHSVQLSGNVPGDEGGQHCGQVGLLHKQVFERRPLPVQIPTGCGSYYRNLSHMDQFVTHLIHMYRLICQMYFKACVDISRNIIEGKGEGKVVPVLN
jgi:hypothetical protein